MSKVIFMVIKSIKCEWTVSSPLTLLLCVNVSVLSKDNYAVSHLLHFNFRSLKIRFFFSKKTKTSYFQFYKEGILMSLQFLLLEKGRRGKKRKTNH